MDGMETNGEAGELLGKERAPAVHVAIAQRIRAMIASGELKPGHRFLPTKELAAELGSYPLAVHKAFQILADEGLVERLHRSGTFVSRQSAVLGSAAIYLGADLFEGDYMKFVCSVHNSLTKLFKKEGIRYASMLDPRGDDEQDKPWPALRAAFERKEFQTLIGLVADKPRLKWLSALPVTKVLNCDVQISYDDFVEKAVAGLEAQGCKSVGLISIAQESMAPIAARLCEAAARRGMKTRPAWLLQPNCYVHGRYAELYGYEQFSKLWRQAERPDGIAVFPDGIVPGIVGAMASLGVKAPADLKLALHKNREIELLCPFQASIAQTSSEKYAAALVDVLKARLQGQEPPKPQLLFTLEENRSHLLRETAEPPPWERRLAAEPLGV